MDTEEVTAAPHSHFRVLNFYPVHLGQHYWKWCPECQGYVCRQCGSPRVSNALMWTPFVGTYTYDPFVN